MIRYAKKRDLVEKDIVTALLKCGASVQRLNETGVPDLLVGFRGATFLLECKDAHGKSRIGGKRTKSGLLDSQDKWWSTWKGSSPVVVTTVHEALEAIGAYLVL